MLKKEIKENLIKALKRGKGAECSVWRLVLTSINNKEKEKKYREKLEKEIDLTDEEISEIIFSEARKRRESITDFKKGGRKDLVEKEEFELELLKKYLPEQLSEEEIKKIARETIKESSAGDIKDMGRVMALLMPKIKGQADGSLVSKIVRDLLAPKE